MPPPTLETRYAYSSLEPTFSRLLSEGSSEPVGVHIRSSLLADLDQDGASDDLVGTALIQVGQRFKNVLFLHLSEGGTRFLEADGSPLDTTTGLQSLPCMESRSWLCPATFERASRYIRSLRISVAEFDPAREGLEVLIHQSRGIMRVVNPMEIFAGSLR